MSNHAYQEGSDSYFIHKQNAYSLNEILRLIKVKAPIATHLNAISFEAMDIDSAQLKNGAFVCQSCSATKQNHKDRVNATNLSAPIILLIENDTVYVVDGMHRIEKAISKKMASLPAYFTTPADLALTKICI